MRKNGDAYVFFDITIREQTQGLLVKKIWEATD